MPGYELVGEDERAAVNELFDDGGILFAHGFDGIRNNRYRVREFEQKFADQLGVRYAQAVSSGTAALKISLLALGVKPGDEVITQAFTFVATVEAIISIGAKPVLINIDETFNMDPKELEKAITDKTAAIIPVHMLGVSVEQDDVHAIARRHAIPILDDACESLGAKWGREKLGVQADISAWSFDAGKTVIAGEGGMITTNNESLFLFSREYHDHGHMYNKALPRGRDTHRIYGFNYRMTELQAAVGLVQLGKLNYIVEKNHKNYDILMDSLRDIGGIKFRRVPSKCTPLCDTLIFRFSDKVLAEKCVSLLASSGIGTKNVPDAIEWHFAKYWDHMLYEIGMSKQELSDFLGPSSEIIESSVAIPIMVNISPVEMKDKAEVIRDAIIKTL